MPKLKTHKGIQKRVRVSPNGKVKYHHAGKGHLLAGKPAKRKRKLRRAAILAPTETPKIRRLLGKR